MEINDVKKIFEERKYEYLKSYNTSDVPTAYILGGQPSSGKSSMVNNLLIDNPNILFINGDLYRRYAPNHQELIQDPDNYSAKTQIFSNVFTEGLISEAIKQHLNISIEGTMRNPSVALGSADMLRKAGYRVEFHVISTPKEFTSINLFHRYKQEVKVFGTGRLADINSHDAACSGIPLTLDEAFDKKAVDRIAIYNLYGAQLQRDYILTKEEWNIKDNPSNFIHKSREQQLHDKALIHLFINKGIDALTYLTGSKKSSDILQNRIESLITVLEETVQKEAAVTAKQKIIELEDEIDRASYSVKSFKDTGFDLFWNECKQYNREKSNNNSITFSEAARMFFDKTIIRKIGDTLACKDNYHLEVNSQPFKIESSTEENNDRRIKR